MSDHLVRVAHLRAIQRANGWNDSELARRVGRKPQQVMSWFKGTRHIGENLARALEQQLSLARWALDDRPSSPPAATDKAPSLTSQPLGRPARFATTNAREVPVITWGDVRVMLQQESPRVRGKRPTLATFAPSSERARFVEMPDDSMAPEIKQGDHLLFDPVEAARAGDVVLVSIAGGEYFVRTFRPKTSQAFEAEPANRNYQALSPDSDGAAVVAVMVEHRSYRRGSR